MKSSGIRDLDNRGTFTTHIFSKLQPNGDSDFGEMTWGGDFHPIFSFLHSYVEDFKLPIFDLQSLSYLLNLNFINCYVILELQACRFMVTNMPCIFSPFLFLSSGFFVLGNYCFLLSLFHYFCQYCLYKEIMFPFSFFLHKVIRLFLLSDVLHFLTFSFLFVSIKQIWKANYLVLEMGIMTDRKSVV